MSAGNNKFKHVKMVVEIAFDISEKESQHIDLPKGRVYVQNLSAVEIPKGSFVIAETSKAASVAIKKSIKVSGFKTAKTFSDLTALLEVKPFMPRHYKLGFRVPPGTTHVDLPGEGRFFLNNLSEDKALGKDAIVVVTKAGPNGMNFIRSVHKPESTDISSAPTLLDLAKMLGVEGYGEKGIGVSIVVVLDGGDETSFSHVAADGRTMGSILISNGGGEVRYIYLKNMTGDGTEPVVSDPEKAIEFIYKGNSFFELCETDKEPVAVIEDFLDVLELMKQMGVRPEGQKPKNSGHVNS